VLNSGVGHCVYRLFVLANAQFSFRVSVFEFTAHSLSSDSVLSLFMEGSIFHSLMLEHWKIRL